MEPDAGGVRERIDAARPGGGPGGPHAGGDRGGARHIEAELPGAGPPGKPPGASADRAGCGSGCAGGAVRGARAADGDWRAGDPEGGRELRAAGPVVSAGSSGVHAGGQRTGGDGGAVGHAGSSGRSAGGGGRPGRGELADRTIASAGGGGAVVASRGVRDLHLGLDGAAEGCDGGTPAGGEPAGVDARPAGDDGGGPLAGGDDAGLRHRGAGAVSATDQRRGGGRAGPGGEPQRAVAVGGAGGQRRDGDAGDAVDVAVAAGVGLVRAAGAEGAVRRGGAAG
ncbi:PE-PGRS family protein [Ralstonia solanacearum SD54]|nr:PE-PGRS family protein [Ralstonia solanacearum SD54]